MTREQLRTLYLAAKTRGLGLAATAEFIGRDRSAVIAYFTKNPGVMSRRAAVDFARHIRAVGRKQTMTYAVPVKTYICVSDASTVGDGQKIRRVTLPAAPWELREGGLQPRNGVLATHDAEIMQRQSPGKIWGSAQ